MVRLFYVFLMTVGWWRGSVSQRNKLQASVAQTALVSKINSLLFSVFQWALSNKRKKDEATAAWFFKCSFGCNKLWQHCRIGTSSSAMCCSTVKRGWFPFFMKVQLRTVAAYSSSSPRSPTCPRPKAACRLHNDLPSARWMAWRYHWGCWDVPTMREGSNNSRQQAHFKPRHSIYPVSCPENPVTTRRRSTANASHLQVQSCRPDG